MEADYDLVHHDLMRLVPLVAKEAAMIAAAFADQHELHETDFEALRLLITADGKSSMSTGELGGELGITSGATTFLVNRLERAGLVERIRDPEDQRKVFLHCTETGRSLAQKFTAPVLHLSAEVMGQFTTEELQIAQRFLEKTTAAMAEYRHALKHMKR